ncbi:pseudouridine synthase [Naviculisporaceae sp. PSN 640]
MASRPQIHVPSVRSETEKSLGIIRRAAPINFSWSGDIRKRYTDFLVYEIRKNGNVVHLEDFAEEAPQPKEDKPQQPPQNSVAPPTEIQAISDDDEKALQKLVGASVASQLIAFDRAIQAKERLPTDQNQVVLDPVSERDRRATIHQEIRRIFSSRIETLADNTGVITATRSKVTTRGNRGGNRGANRGGRGGNQQVAGRGNNRPRDQSFAQLGGDYLHFTLYKENKDTMEAINTIARLLKVKASNFGFAGTKDRRAGTVQRVSVYKQRPTNMNWLNTRFHNLKIGDYSYHKEPLQLGQHGGNEFIITLKNCRNQGDAECSALQRARMVQESVEFALAYVKKHGYINYYGLQRFGTYNIGTHVLGMKVLNDDFQGTVEALLHVNDQYLHEVLENNQNQASRDDYNRAKAISSWTLTKNAERALELMPKRFSAEIALIRHLSKNPNDYLGALLSITRGMRMMYIHAYQSYVWNFVATHRWAKYGPNVIVGDLVLVDQKEGLVDGLENDTFDEDNYYAQARVLTEDDVASGAYTIFDIVLPTPGYDVIYPQNDVGSFYKTFMGREENGGLDPYNMRRKNKEFSLSGNYRPLIGRFLQEPQYAIRLYSEDTEQMYPTDLDICKSRKVAAKAAAKATAGRWDNFANNAAIWDKAVAQDRRRKASEEPIKEEIVTTETWVQTGLDESAKRIKIARESHQERVSLSPPTRPDEPVVPQGSDDLITLGALPPAGEQSSVMPPSAATVMKEESMDIDLPEDESATNGIKQESPPPSALGSENPMAWFGDNTPSLPPTIKSAHVSTSSDSADSLVIPEFYSPSENPFLSLNGKIHDSSSGGSKIAVVLKFQLKSSNYATVVLRELMGANANLQG